MTLLLERSDFHGVRNFRNFRRPNFMTLLLKRLNTTRAIKLVVKGTPNDVPVA